MVCASLTYATKGVNRPTFYYAAYFLCTGPASVGDEARSNALQTSAMGALESRAVRTFPWKACGTPASRSSWERAVAAWSRRETSCIVTVAVGVGMEQEGGRGKVKAKGSTSDREGVHVVSAGVNESRSREGGICGNGSGTRSVASRAWRTPKGRG